MKYIIGLFAALLIVGASFMPSDASALSVKIAPLHYDAKLGTGEVQKGYVDVVNTSAQDSVIRLSVRAYEQTDDEGSLKFYEDEAVQAGVKLDLNEIELTPGEGARVFFVLDGVLLPEGDVFAAILATNSPVAERSGVNTATSVGTLLTIENGTPGSRTAKVTSLSGPWLHIGDQLALTMKVKNTAPAGERTGFFPEITMSFKPYGQDTVRGPLVFAGRERQVEYRAANAYFGPLLIEAKTAFNNQEKWVFAVTGFWRWLAPLILVTIICIVTIFVKLRKRQKA